MAKNTDPFGFASAIQIDHLTEAQLDLLNDILKDVK